MLLHHAEDPRTPWERFRRKQLERICFAEGIQYEEGEPAPDMRVRLGRKGVDVNKYAYLINGGPLHGNESGRQENRTDGLTKPVEAKPDPGKVTVDLSFFTRPQLMQLCAQQNIPVTNTDKKEDLIRKLNG